MDFLPRRTTHLSRGGRAERQDTPPNQRRGGRRRLDRPTLASQNRHHGFCGGVGERPTPACASGSGLRSVASPRYVAICPLDSDCVYLTTPFLSVMRAM